MRRSLLAVLIVHALLSVPDAGSADLYFDSWPTLEFPVHIAYARLFFVRDVNGDGRSDLIDVFPAESLTKTTVTVFLSDGVGALVPGTPTVFSGAGFERVTAGHRNPDGSLDLMACHAFVMVAVVSLGVNSGAASVPMPSGVQCTTPIAADFNGDGYDDLVYVQSTGATFTMLRQPLGFAAQQAVPATLTSAKLITGDFNGDGRADLARHTSSQISVLLAGSGGSWTTVPTQALPPCPTAVPGDFDGDGADDIVCKDSSTPDTAIRVLRSNGSGVFTQITSVTFSGSGQGAYAIRDFDGDGHADVLAGDRIVLNNGSDQLGQMVSVGIRTQSFGDFDADGRADLLPYDSTGTGGNRYTLLLTANLSRGWRPTITSAGALARTQGSTGTTATIATVSDIEDDAGSLVVTAPIAPAGVSLSNIANAAGTITATVTAGCSASSGNIFLRVTDSDGATNTTGFAMTVAANPPPQLGNYPSASGANVTVTPDRAPFDPNGTLASCAAIGPPGFTGTVAIDQASGQVRISGTTVPGRYTITVSATDNCGATASTAFALDVPNDVPTASPLLLVLLAVVLVVLAWWRTL